MGTVVIMPKMGVTMDEGSIGSWLKQEGDEVLEGEPIAEIVTDKTVTELEAPASGILAKILKAEGEDAKITEPIAVIIEEGEDPDEVLRHSEFVQSLGLADDKEKEDTAGKDVVVEPIGAARGEDTTGADDGKRVKSSPAARKLASELGIDISSVVGTGPGGRITVADVEQASKSQLTETGSDCRVAVSVPPYTGAHIARPLSPIRKTIAKRMTQNAQNIPHVTLVSHASMVKCKELRQAMSSKEMKISFTSMFIKACAKALRHHPDVNVSMGTDEVICHAHVNIGVAVHTAQGLLVPVVKDADTKGLMDIDKEVRQLSEKARSGRLSEDDVAGGTFTVSNLGMFEIDVFTPIINAPEAAILGVGSITERATMTSDMLFMEPQVGLCLSIDHRLIDGAPGAEFLATIKRIVESADFS